MANLNYASAPNNLGQTLKLYIENRVPMGGFMMAVAQNDLKEAFGRADYINRTYLFEIVQWFYNEAPHDCWGSREKVEAWLKTEKPEPSADEEES